jgi:vanillate monooxygenase ferredoxin subunit
MTSTTGTIRARVAAKKVEATGVCSFELVSEGGGPLPAFSAGSHIDVKLQGGLTRQYSLCNDPAEQGRYVIAVLREAAGRGGSVAMHDQVQAGDVVTVSTPRNHFPLAGGIGVTPILCMAERLHAIGAEFAMHYCARSEDRAAFRRRILAAPYASKVHFHFDDGDAAQKFDLVAHLGNADTGVHLYVCGPQGFMDAVLGTARANGWPEAQLHYEFFGAGAQLVRDGEAFEVKLASSGRVIDVPGDRTVAQALEFKTFGDSSLVRTLVISMAIPATGTRSETLPPPPTSPNPLLLRARLCWPRPPAGRNPSGVAPCGNRKRHVPSLARPRPAPRARSRGSCRCCRSSPW